MNTQQNGKSADQPRIPLNWWGLVVRAFVAFFILLVANFVRAPFLLIPWVQSEPNRATLISAILPFLTMGVVFICVALWMKHVERRPIASAGFSNPRELLPGLLMGIGIVAIPCLASAYVLRTFVDNNAEVEGLAGFGVTEILLGLLALFAKSFVLQGIPEELLYRGWLFSLTRARPFFTVAWTTVAFTIIHLVSEGGQQNLWERIEYLTLPFAMGLLAGAVVLLTGNAWCAAGTHGGMHLFNGLLPLVIAFEQSGQASWFVPAIMQGVMAMVLLAIWWQRRGSESK